MAGLADLDQYETTERVIEILIQRGSCSSYYSQFFALIAQLGWTKDSDKIHYFRRGLKDSVKDNLVVEDCPVTISEFAALYIKVRHQIRLADAKEKISQNRQNLYMPNFFSNRQCLIFRN